MQHSEGACEMHMAARFSILITVTLSVRFKYRPR